MDPGEASYFQYLIVILWWMVDIGCVDICYEVSIMYSHHEKEDEPFPNNSYIYKYMREETSLHRDVI